MKLIYRILLRLSLALLAVLTVWTVFFYFTMIDEINDDVIPHRQGDDEIDPGDGQQEHQVLVGILVGVGVVRVAAVAAHGQAVQLAHEMVLKGGADDLLMVVQVFRADEADHRIDHER